jgi:hypothetical protein
LCYRNRFVVIASKQLPLVEAIITFQKLRKFNFGKVIIASSRGKTLLETKNVSSKNYKKMNKFKKKAWLSTRTGDLSLDKTPSLNTLL